MSPICFEFFFQITLSELKKSLFLLDKHIENMFSKACEYAIRATIFIAKESMKGKRSNLTEISKAITSPIAFTAKILQTLVKHKIIFSIKGARGGFEMLPQTINTLSLKHLVVVIDDDYSTTACIIGLNKCSSENPCPLHEQYESIRTDLSKMLEETKIIQLIEKESFKIGNHLF